MTTAKPVRLFLVDDHPLVRDGLRARLGTMPGLEIVGEAGSAAEALAQVEALRPDLMLVDVNMPKMDGYQMIDRVRRQPDLCAVAILTISSESKNEDAARAYEAGANLYMVKPVTPEELIEAVGLLAGAA